MRFLPTLSLLAWCAVCSAGELRLLVQRSPLAGSQYYALGEYWSRIRPGDRLQLVREPGNRHDPKAIRVEWQGHMLGYIPRAENRALAAAMDRGEQLSGRVSALDDNENPWQRLALEVFIEL